MKNIHLKYFTKIFGFLLFLCVYQNVDAQITIRVTGTSSGCTTCDNDDREWKIGIEHVSGGGTNAGGNDETGYENCGSSRTTDYDVTHYCPGGTVRVRAYVAEYGRTIQPWHFCETSNSQTQVINGPSNVSGGFNVSGSSSGSISYTIQTSGDYRVNARLGNQNFSCPTAWVLPTNGTGTPITGHTTNCGDAWYRYDLTDANRSYIEFEPTAGGANTSEIVEVKYVNCTGCELGGDASWLGNSYRVTNPRPGSYFVRVRVNETWAIGSSDYRFDLEVRKGATVTIPANDNLCDAISLHATFNYNSGNLSATANTSSASSEDYCGMNEPESDNEKTVWYKFTTGANPPANININPNAGDWDDYGVAILYRQNSAPNCGSYPSTSFFSFMSKVGESTLGSSFDVNCLAANTTYFLQLFTRESVPLPGTKDDGPISVLITNSGVNSGPDKICDAIDLGASPYGTPLSNTTNTDLFITNQTNVCASAASGEPDAFPVQSIDKTVWYKFTTPADYYTSGAPVSRLAHIYDIEVDRLGGSLDAWPTFAVYEQTADTTRNCSPENATSFNNLSLLDYTQNLDFGDASVKDLCLKPNTTYYIQIDHACVACIGDDYVNFSVRVKKSAFRPGDQICNAAVIPTSVVSGLNKTTTISTSPLTGSPFFGLPHTNKCTSADNGEPDISPGGPATSGGHSSSVWYEFTTDANPAEWIEWDHDDYTSGRGVRGSVCTGLLFNSKINIYQSKVNGCIYPSLVIQSEYDTPAEIPPASLSPGIFRLRCPLPNTTYYVQVLDMGASPCFEGVYEPFIKTAPTTRGVPINDEPCGAIDLGTVPAGGQLAPVTIFDNFCSTPTTGFIADQTQPLERDVWFSFIAPPSGSVLITSQSAPTGSPSTDNDIDLQIAVWEPILGDHNKTPHCSSPRYLWTPIISRDHDILDYGDVPVISTSYYDILDTKNNLINEGNSLIATCLNPGKMYYIQVDGGEYLACDLFNGGNCLMGYFKLQVKDAGLYDMASMATAPAGNDEPCGAKSLPISNSSGPIQWTQGSNLCATAINDPLPNTWYSSDATVWYKFIAPASGKVKIRAENISQINKRDKANPNSPNPTLTTSDADYHEELNLQLAVYTMGNCMQKNSLVYHSSSYDGSLVENNFTNEDDYVGIATNGFDEYLVARCLIPGKEYYIMVDGENDPTLGIPGLTSDIEDVVGDFRISVQDYATVPASLNDNVCNSFEIPNVHTLGVNANRTTGYFNNECATIEPHIEGSGKIAEKMEGMLFNVTAKKTLWFKFRAPASGKVKIEGLNSGNDKIDLAMALYDFPNENCNLATSGYKIADDYDPGVAAWGEDEEMTVECLIPDRYYYLQVDGANNITACPDLGFSGSRCATGEFRLRVTHLPDAPRSDIPPQKNDDFCDAINLGNLNPGGSLTRLNQNNRCSTEEINEPDGEGWNFSLFDDQIRSVWYRFKTGFALGPLAPGPITITADNPDPDPCFDIDLELFEYSGTFNSTSCITQSNSNSQFNRLLKVGVGESIGLIPLTDANRSEDLTIDCPKPNTEYFVRITGSSTCPGFGATMGTFDLNVSMSSISILVETNDNICETMTAGNSGNMGLLASGGSLQRLAHNNFCATQELNEPNTTQSAFQNEPEFDETMWYRFRTSATPGEIKVKLETVLTTGFASLPSLTVYKGSSSSYNPCTNGFGGLIEVASDMGSATLVGGITKQDAEVTLPCPSANWNYFIQVDGYDMSLLGFALPGFLYSDNFIYNVKVNDDGSGDPRPANDKVVNAIPVDSIAPLDGMLTSGGALSIKGHNQCATADDNEPRFDDLINAGYNGSNTTDHQSLLEDETVWYYFITPSNPGVTRVRVQDDPNIAGNFTPNFSIFYNDGNNPTYRVTGAPSEKLIQEGAAASNVGNSTNISEDYTCLLPNTKYYIQIDGNDLSGRDQGHFIVTVTDDGSGNPALANDLVCNAEDLTALLVQNGTMTVNRTNYCSWEEEGEPNTSGNMGGSGDDVTSNDYDETVWFRFRPPYEGKFVISVSTSHNFILYRSSGTAAYNCTTPDWSRLTRMSSSGGQNTGEFSCLDNSVWYYIQIDGDDTPGDDVGPFTLTINHEDGTIYNHDMVCNAYDLGTVNNTTSSAPVQSNFCATEELGEPNVSGNFYNMEAVGYDKTLWYRFRTPAQQGEWNISVTNNSPFNDRISGTFTLYQANGSSICSSGVPVWSNLTERLNAGVANVSTGNNSETIECFRLYPNTYYFLQVHGEDFGVAGGEVGTNFTVEVTHIADPAASNDNVCSAMNIAVGAAATAGDNLCATSQIGEPDISPVPQDPFTSGYDETMWYRFVAPVEGYVKIEGRSLASDEIDLNMTLYELPAGVTNICTAGEPNWALLNKIGEADNLISYDFDYENECLIPGRTYLFKIDGGDVLNDRGNYTVRVLNQYLNQPVVCPPIPNDEPCGLPGAFDITAWVREDPCPSGNMNYPSNYSIFDSSPDIDCARRSTVGMSCGSRTNCSDYWFKFTVPMDSEGGIKIQGDDEYGFAGANSSTLVVGAYRGNPCTGEMQFLGCDYGGLTRDVEFDIAAIPGETIYLQVFNDNGAASPSYPNFGLCVSTKCAPKNVCSSVVSLDYDIPQCWNLDEDNSPLNNSGGSYGNCLPSGATSANYFTFSTECGATSDGEPDTVTLVFSVNNIASNTAIAIYEDATPCDGVADGILVNCVPFGNCTGCSPSTTFTQTYQLDECKTYVIQVLGEDDDEDGSSGQIYVFKSTLDPPVLPIELLSFTGYHDGEYNQLNWLTASEKNADRFIIEKSSDGEHFQAIGSVAAAGNTTELQKYAFLDTDAEKGYNYYRLKIEDFDGKFEYSNVIIIDVAHEEPVLTTSSILSVYPNPTDAVTTVDMYVHEKEADFDIQVVNVLGQVMHTETLHLNKGNASFQINASRYAQGAYIISITNKQTMEIMDVRFIKQ